MGLTIKTEYAVYEGVFLQVSKYAFDNSLAVMAENRQDGPIATLTVNLQDGDLEENEAYVDTNNCPWVLDFIKEHNLGTLTGKKRQRGFCTYPAVKFDIDQLEKLGLEA